MAEAEAEAEHRVDVQLNETEHEGCAAIAFVPALPRMLILGWGGLFHFACGCRPAEAVTVWMHASCVATSAFALLAALISTRFHHPQGCWWTKICKTRAAAAASDYISLRHLLTLNLPCVSNFVFRQGDALPADNELPAATSCLTDPQPAGSTATCVSN